MHIAANDTDNYGRVNLNIQIHRFLIKENMMGAGILPCGTLKLLT